MDYHNVSCQTLMLQYFKDTLRYVKLFGALKSILKHCGPAVPESKAGGWQWHCRPADGSEPGPSSTDGNQWNAPSAAPGHAASPVPAACGHNGTPHWDMSRGTARLHPSIPLPAGELGAGDREGPPETATRHEPRQRGGGHSWEWGEEPWALRTPVCREVVSAAPNEALLWGSEKLPPPSARCVMTAGDETLASVPGAALHPARS